MVPEMEMTMRKTAVDLAAAAAEVVDELQKAGGPSDEDLADSIRILTERMFGFMLLTGAAVASTPLVRTDYDDLPW